jgi:hypothetical protein
VVLTGWIGCAGSGRLQRADAHETARAQTHEHSAAAKQSSSSKNGDHGAFESVLPVVID